MMNQMMMSTMRKMKISSMMILTVLIMNQMIPRIKCLPGKMTIHLFQPQEHLPDKKMPAWTKEFVMMNQKQPDWLQRAVFVK